MNKDKWFLNGGRGSGRSFRLLCEIYENKIADLEKENAELKAVERMALYSKMSDQLAKAKELLKKTQGYTENLDDEADKLYDEIEQLLNEVEK